MPKSALLIAFITILVGCTPVPDQLGGTRAAICGGTDGGTLSIVIGLRADSWWKGPYASGPGTQVVGNGPRGYLAAMIDDDISNGALPAGLTVEYRGSGSPTGNTQWNHHDAVGGSTCADHINGNAAKGATAISAYYGEGNPGGGDIGVVLSDVGHNDSLVTYKGTSGEVAMNVAIHTQLPDAVIVACSAPGKSTGTGTFDQMNTYNISTGWPAMRAAGIDVVECNNPGATLLSTDVVTDGHPNDSGDQKIAAATHEPLRLGILRALMH
jgi:hypothetical protein